MERSERSLWSLSNRYEWPKDGKKNAKRSGGKKRSDGRSGCNDGLVVWLLAIEDSKHAAAIQSRLAFVGERIIVFAKIGLWMSECGEGKGTSKALRYSFVSDSFPKEFSKSSLWGRRSRRCRMEWQREMISVSSLSGLHRMISPPNWWNSRYRPCWGFSYR